MTKSETINNLKAYLNGDTAIGNIIPLRSVLESAIKYLSEPSLPSELDEAAERILSETFPQLHNGSFLTEREMVKLIKAGAEWMAGQGISMPAHIFMPSGIKSVYDYSKGEYPAAVHLDCGGSLVLEKRLQNFNHNEEVIVQIRKKE